MGSGVSKPQYHWLDNLFLSSYRSDIEVLVEADDKTIVKFPAHLLVLCTQNPKLNTIISDPETNRNGEIDIVGIDSRSAGYFLRAFYVGTIPEIVPEHNLLELLKVTHQYETRHLMDMTQEMLIKDTTLNMACLVYETATSLNEIQLQQTCEALILSNLDTILKNDLHYDLKEDSFNYFLECKPKLPADLREDSLLRFQNWNSFLLGEDIEPRKGINSTYHSEPEVLPWMRDLCLSAKNSDIEFRVTDNAKAKFCAHSLVLNQHSEVFNFMFLSEESRFPYHVSYKKVIELDNVSARILEYLLRFMYTRFFPTEISDTNLMQLLRAAHFYKIQQLILKCITSLTNSVSITNCCQIFALSKELGLEKLEASSLSTILYNLDTILENTLHFVLNSEELFHIISRATCTKFNGDELSNYVRMWAKWRCCIEGTARDSDLESGLPLAW